MHQFDRFAPPSNGARNAVIVGGVVLFHAAALWALQSGLARKPVEIIVPVQVMAELIAPPAPIAPPTPPKPPAAPPQAKPAPPVPRPAVVPKRAPRPTPTPTPTPAPLAIANTPAVADAPVVAVQPQAPAEVAAPVAPAAAPAPPVPAAPPRIDLPSSNATYLQNPAPGYPSISKRMGEQGKVLLRVFIAADGTPQKIELNKSSGFERLDRQAQDAVMRWRFVPGKRNGVPEAMWYLVPINFVLE